jgi:hypothetical protein
MVFKVCWESHEQLGMNGSPISVRNYPQCERKLQGSRHKGFLVQWRVFRGYLVHTRATGNEGINGKDV